MLKSIKIANIQIKRRMLNWNLTILYWFIVIMVLWLLMLTSICTKYFKAYWNQWITHINCNKCLNLSGDITNKWFDAICFCKDLSQLNTTNLYHATNTKVSRFGHVQASCNGCSLFVTLLFINLLYSQLPEKLII